MMLLEHIGKAELAARGVPLPRGFLAETPDAAAEAATLLGGPVVVKAQVPAGGRGKQGGILSSKDHRLQQQPPGASWDGL